MPNILNRFTPMNTAEVLDKAVEVYKKSFLKQLAFSAIVGVIGFVLMIITGIVLAIILVVNNTNASVADYNVLGMINFAFIFVLLLAVPILLIWQSVYSAGHIMLAKQAFYGEEVWLTVRELPRTALRVLSVIVAQFLVSIPFLGAGILGIVAFFAMDIVVVETAVIFIVIAVVVLMIGYFIFTNIFALSIAVAVYEKQYFIGAIIRSWHLIKGEFWKIFGIRMVWAIAVLVVGYAAQGLLNLATMLGGFVDSVVAGMVIVMVFSMISGFVSIILTFATMPLEGIMQATLYFNQRIKREGLDIEAAIERLES